MQESNHFSTSTLFVQICDIVPDTTIYTPKSPDNTKPEDPAPTIDTSTAITTKPTPEIEREVIKRKYITHISHRGEEKGLINTRYYSARRWAVIERTNPWHNRFRKLLVRYEKKSENYLALVCLACCIIVYRRIILG